VLCIVLRGCWCDTILNAHTSTEGKSDDAKDKFYKELEQLFDQFPMSHMNSVRRFHCKIGESRFFKLTIGNKSLHENTNDNLVSSKL
jgi:hypothetical protein